MHFFGFTTVEPNTTTVLSSRKNVAALSQNPYAQNTFGTKFAQNPFNWYKIPSLKISSEYKNPFALKSLQSNEFQSLVAVDETF